MTSQLDRIEVLLLEVRNMLRRQEDVLFPLDRCTCDGGPQGEGLVSIPHEPHCPLAKQEHGDQ